MGGKVTAGPDVVTVPAVVSVAERSVVIESAVVASVVLGVAKSVVEDSDIGKSVVESVVGISET